jgi:hypothetical protein
VNWGQKRKWHTKNKGNKQGGALYCVCVPQKRDSFADFKVKSVREKRVKVVVLGMYSTLRQLRKTGNVGERKSGWRSVA